MAFTFKTTCSECERPLEWAALPTVALAVEWLCALLHSRSGCCRAKPVLEMVEPEAHAVTE